MGPSRLVASNIKKIMKSLFYLLAFAMAFSQVLAFEEDYEVQDEARFLMNTGNGMFVSLNSTYFVFALGGLVLLAFFGLFLYSRNGQTMPTTDLLMNLMARNIIITKSNRPGKDVGLHRMWLPNWLNWTPL